ncbi:MAG TPA: DUF4430 domain-containing protein [Candidatus Limnocylindrales bacterium]|nr:DUF4430 domain-containing protein [Candidatus Limnocylindrales bacterium]
MEKGIKKTTIIGLGIFLLLLGGATLVTVNNPSKIVSNPTPTIVSEKKSVTDRVSYPGENGKDALTLLKAFSKVEQGSSGLVTSINSRLAEDKNKEFWAFYVNGKMSEVGPADYVTKDADKIEWKIEKY